MKRLVTIAVGLALAGGLSAWALGEKPEEKGEEEAAVAETIEINHLDGSRGPVTFHHAEHSTEYKKLEGKGITCKDCHHTLEKETAEPADVQACTACHVNEGEEQKEHGGKKAPFLGEKRGKRYSIRSILYHGACLDCHKEMRKEGKKIFGCTTCHPKDEK